MEHLYQQQEPPSRSGIRNWTWNRFSIWQMFVMGVAAIPGLVIGAVAALRALGALTTEQMTEVALGAGENPGIIVFGLMFCATPMQWWTGRSQVRVRKYLGITFFLLALNNGIMFIVEEDVDRALTEPFLIAGSVALLLAVPLFVTSSRRSQRSLGLRRWQLLHRLTYVVAAALLLHVSLIPDIGPGFALISAGFVARLPASRQYLQSRSERRRAQRSAGVCPEAVHPVANAGV